jgi:YesN/AraC family two-component response regulator
MIIADDEPAVRQYIHYVVKQYKLPFLICGEAVDGEQAVQMADRYQPEFAILDINMPIMNGLDAAAAIKEKDPDVVIYVLTAYSQFEYAHKAVQTQVADYLLKPIRPLDLVAILKKGIAGALKRRLTLLRNQRMAQQIAKDRPVVVKQLLFELLNSDSDNPNVLKLLQRMSQKVKFCPAAVISISQCQNIQTPLHNKLNERLTQDCISRFEEQAITTSFGGEIVLIFRQWNDELCCELQSRMEEWERRYAVTLYAGISIVDKPSRIGEAYNNAKKQREAGLFWRQQGFLMIDGVVNENAEVDYTTIQKQIRDFLIERQSNIAKAIVHQFLEEARQKLCQPEYVYAVVMKIAGSLIDKYAEYILSVTDASLLRVKFNTEVKKAASANDLEKCLEILIDTLESYVSPKEHNDAERSVKWAVEYINENYHKDLNLEKIAEKLFVSTGYFCRIFKRYTGEGYATYLTTIRLNKAKEILMTGQYTVAEVARMVGFNDASYFSSVFKKRFNQSPSQLAAAVTRQDS